MNRNFDLVPVRPTLKINGVVLWVNPAVVDRPGNKANMTGPPAVAVNPRVV
jgi:hypothetical protein